MGLFSKIFGSYSDKEMKRIEPIIQKIEALADEYAAMSDEQLRAMTAKFKQRLTDGETLDDILPEAFAAVRETSTRVLGMRHYRVQLMGGVVLYQGRIAEMKTGEGKTLVATLPAYLMSLTGEGVHIVTVNDYLAKRDSEWMGKIYRFLDVSVGLIVHGIDNVQRKAAYAADITYGTNNEFGFDYLRDNMVIYKDEMVQRSHVFAIIDEVDSILIDEARTPLIISGRGEDSSRLYMDVDKFVCSLKPVKVAQLDDKESHDEIKADYIIDEKAGSAMLTPHGVKKAEARFALDNLMDPQNMALLHHINQAIHAHGVKTRDIDYVVKDDQIIIVDEFGGRLMHGRRYSDGLHQAIEAKEGVKIESESKTFASITFQNYFRLYRKISGMTGTAMTEEEEFREIYKLDVVDIPTNMPMIRDDRPDVIYRTEDGKFQAVVKMVKERHEKGQPVLVGTISIEKSERLSELLRKNGVPHEVLNAKHHEKEAQIIAQAGKLGAVTIATNMAGRGTDIMLGGNGEFLAKRHMLKEDFTPELIFESTEYSDTGDEQILAARARYKELISMYEAQIKEEAQKVRELGGLFIIGTERHDSRRIDNQLRGRAGRQGDPGESRFLISLEDDIARLFAGERIKPLMSSFGFDDDEPIEHKMLSGIIENAQKAVEGRNFQVRKNVLQYDDVLNQQREVIYAQRLKVLDGEDLRPAIVKMIEHAIDGAIATFCAGDIPDNWDIKGLRVHFEGVFLTQNDLAYQNADFDYLTKDTVRDELLGKAMAFYEKKEQNIGADAMRNLERFVLLQMVDSKWMDHIDAMSHLRQTVGLRAYGQRDPIVEYKFESFDMFEQMVASIEEDTVKFVFLMELRSGDAPKRERRVGQTNEQRGDNQTQRASKSDGSANNKGTVVRNGPKIGRNDQCPCGSGKKYKKCCGR